MNLKFFSVLSLIFCLSSLLPAQNPIEVPGVSPRVWGAGMAMTNFDNNPRPEMILMAYDMSKRPNVFRYKVGWNLDTHGVADRWSNDMEIPGAGWLAEGAGVTIAQLDDNPAPEMILMIYFYDEVNPFRYKIGWNLDANGRTTSWNRDYYEVPGVGWEGSGAGATIVQLDNNPRPEMILLAYDNPAATNFFRYRVGWNLTPDGKAVDWSNYIEALGVGWESTGAGAAVAQLDDNPRPEIILMGYDQLPEQPEFFCYRVGWNLKDNGMPANWGEYKKLPGMGPGVKGADIAVFNLDADARPELILMACLQLPQDKKSVFRYQVLKNEVSAKRIVLEMDKLHDVKWFPDKVSRGGATHSLQGIYAAAGIHLDSFKDKGSIRDIKKGKPYTDAEIHSFLVAHRQGKVPAGAWSMYTAALTAHDEGISGIMLNIDHRRGVVLFANEFKDDDLYLRSLAHHMGIAFNLNYSDGNSWLEEDIKEKNGYSIMNPTWKLDNAWSFTWSAASLGHFYHHLVNHWQPQKPGGFIKCH